jgi:MFS family permease
MQKYLRALIIAGVADAISFMVVSPSLVFYVLEQSGTKEQYGLIMSSFSFASFLAKPFLGHFSDKYGFRQPYVISLCISCLGAILYVAASNFSTTHTTLFFGMNGSVASILLARLLMGVGAANAALGYAYVARVAPSEEQTSINAFLSMGRIGGMSVGPGFNALLAEFHFSVWGQEFDPFNSVGLVVLFCNLAALAAVLVLLEEPSTSTSTSKPQHAIDGPPDKQESSMSDASDEEEAEAAADKTTTTLLDNNNDAVQTSFNMLQVLEACLTSRVIVPIFSIFMFNANFQL